MYTNTVDSYCFLMRTHEKRTIDSRYGVPRPLSSRDRIYQVYFFSRPPERPCIRRLRGDPQRQLIAAMATNTPSAAAVSVRFSRVLVDFSAFVAERATGDVNLPVHIIKEMTIVDIDSGCYQTWIYKQLKESYHWDGSEPLEKHNQWLIDHYHGLEYHLGFADYESLTDTLNHQCGGASLLIAANRVKARILEDLLYMKQAVVDVESLGCPPSPNAKIFSRSVAAFDGVSIASYYDTPREQEHSTAEREKIWPFCFCLNHRILGGRFDVPYLRRYTWRCGSNGTRRPGHYFSRCVRYITIY